MINKVLFVSRGGCPERNTAELMWPRVNEGYGFHTFRTEDGVGRQVASLAVDSRESHLWSSLLLCPAPLVHWRYVLPLRSSQGS